MAAKKKFYAVRKGKKTGIFYTWDECKAAVNGYSGAVYKSFLTEEEAQAYLTGASAGQQPAGAAQNAPKAQPEHHLVAYVDGSFDVHIGRYSFGCVLLTPNGEIIRKSGHGDNPEAVAIRNVAGEMSGAMHAVQWCKKNGYRSIEIYYDYMGIEMWATGGWKAKNQLTQQYADFMKKYSESIQITFHKVAAHTGDKYNEEADQLAKAALHQQ